MHCTVGCLREHCLSQGLEADATRELNQAVSNRVRVKRRDSLYRPGDPFTALYAICIGTFKTLVLAEDGREQITGFYMGGEIVGFDGISDERHTCESVALEDGEVSVLPFGRVAEFADAIPTLRGNLNRCISRDIRRGQDTMLLLGSMRAEERLAFFLLNLARRYRERGYSASEFVLRMTREEIASFLGLKLETVSRLFSRLRTEGLIEVEGRAVKLLDPATLKRMVGHR